MACCDFGPLCVRIDLLRGHCARTQGDAFCARLIGAHDVEAGAAFPLAPLRRQLSTLLIVRQAHHYSSIRTGREVSMVERVHHSELGRMTDLV